MIKNDNNEKFASTRIILNGGKFIFLLVQTQQQTDRFIIALISDSLVFQSTKKLSLLQLPYDAHARTPEEKVLTNNPMMVWYINDQLMSTSNVRSVDIASKGLVLCVLCTKLWDARWMPDAGKVTYSNKQHSNCGHSMTHSEIPIARTRARTPARMGPGASWSWWSFLCA